MRAALLDWFGANGRRLPGRRTQDPWRVLLIEIASQQTQIRRSLDAAGGLVTRFPTPALLAAAPQADVVRAWAGLGYNRRALALHAAARAIVERHGGEVPSGIDALLALPGVGPYTARAVAARAFGRPVGPVDVNVRRALGRVLGNDRPPTTQELADELAGAPPRGAVRAPDPALPGRVADALMDLAALVCRPRAPDCPSCPLLPWCSTGVEGVTAGAGLRARPASPAPLSDVGGLVGSTAARTASGAERAPFRATRRWLRGQLLREVAGASPGAWATISGPRGVHDARAVRETLGALEMEGFIELDSGSRARLAES